MGLDIHAIILQLIEVSLPHDKLDRDEHIQNLTPINNVSTGPPSPDDPEFSFYVGKETPKASKFSFDDMMTVIISEELYPLYIELDKVVFIAKFNQIIYSHISKKLEEARERNVPDTDNIWMQPNIAFINWFQKDGIDIDNTNPLFTTDKSPEELITGEKSKKWSYQDDYELCERLSNNKHVPTPEEELRKKNKTFQSNRTKWWDRPKRKYRDKFINIFEELEHQTQMEVTKFRKILNVKSDYHCDALLNAFTYAVNHPDGKLYKKAHKKKVSIQNIRKGKILLLK